ncbi:MAG: cysteine desulfurase family protein [Pseudomonadota bacterium]
MARTYLDHNATMPLRAEARGAMLAAMDVLGNPSSIHAEGRAAKALIERARSQIADAFDIGDADVVFTSGATEAAALALAEYSDPQAGDGAPRRLVSSDIEHDCVRVWSKELATHLQPNRSGQIDSVQAAKLAVAPDARAILAVQAANSETGVLQSVEKFAGALDGTSPRPLLFTDAVQIAGKIPWSFEKSRADMAILSAHKMGGPKGIGALILRRGIDLAAQIKGGGQEMGRRSGTENLIGIAGFGAAAAQSIRDLDDGLWDRVAELRKILEKEVEARARDTILVGKDASRLPNTSCLMVPGWKGETQVMQMDLAGFAISAGSACSSGKVKSSAALRALGFSDSEAGSAIRVSLAPETNETQIFAFIEAWTKAQTRFRERQPA